MKPFVVRNVISESSLQGSKSYQASRRKWPSTLQAHVLSTSKQGIYQLISIFWRHYDEYACNKHAWILLKGLVFTTFNHSQTTDCYWESSWFLNWETPGISPYGVLSSFVQFPHPTVPVEFKREKSSLFPSQTVNRHFTRQKQLLRFLDFSQ